MDEKKIKVILTKEELEEILRDLPGFIKELEREIREKEQQEREINSTDQGGSTIELVKTFESYP